jgi:hypothetical protein
VWAEFVGGWWKVKHLGGRRSGAVIGSRKVGPNSWRQRNSGKVRSSIASRDHRSLIRHDNLHAYQSVRWLLGPPVYPQQSNHLQYIAPWRRRSRSSSRRLLHRAPTSSTSRRKSRRTGSRYCLSPRSPHHSRSRTYTSCAMRATGTCARSTRASCSSPRACSASRARSRTARR